MYALGSILVIEHYPAVVDYLRVAASLGSGFVLFMLLATYRRRPSNMLLGAAVFSVLSMFGEAQQIGEPFVVYQLPVRILVIWLFWRAYRAKEHLTVITSSATTSASASRRTSGSDGSAHPAS